MSDKKSVIIGRCHFPGVHMQVHGMRVCAYVSACVCTCMGEGVERQMERLACWEV